MRKLGVWATYSGPHDTKRKEGMAVCIPPPNEKKAQRGANNNSDICVNSTVKCYTKNNGNRFRLWCIVKFPVQRTRGKLIKKGRRYFHCNPPTTIWRIIFSSHLFAATRFFPVLARYGRKNSTNSEVCGMTVGYSCIFILWIGVFTSQWLPTAKKCEI